MDNIHNIIGILDELYPDAACSLNNMDIYQLTIATILSAQCTDERVNLVTKSFFEKYPNFYALADAPLDDIKNEIRSTGFYNNKAMNIKELAKIVVRKYNGEMPLTMDILVTLPGIGRKTANVLLGEYGEVEGIVVDTHVKRLANLIGLSKSNDPERIEKDLTEIIPKNRWRKISHQLIQHGRNVCIARKPKCDICRINKYCKFFMTSNIDKKDI
ncbi:MAG: endonuclease III [Calditerrivibrio sp.]|nr:endonuclease III [Calditerrivibrio sp.]